MIRFTVPGEPVPKARPRVVNGRTYTPKRTVEAEKAIGWAFREAMPGFDPLTCLVGMCCTFYTKSQKPRADVDNLVKTVQDALEGIVYVNDRQVEDVRGHRFRGAADPRTVIEIWRVSE